MGTHVLFRKWKQADDPILSSFVGDICALFPYECDSYDASDECDSYYPIGQHGMSNYEYVLSLTVPAKPEEYKELLDELVNLCGYDDLIVMKRVPNKHYAYKRRCKEVKKNKEIA